MLQCSAPFSLPRLGCLSSLFTGMQRSEQGRPIKRRFGKLLQRVMSGQKEMVAGMRLRVQVPSQSAGIGAARAMTGERII
mmetsp:Transcript_65805/g.109155  ORF Transcript_65805/g.109155 Transcript_65805/m.109155 type:complete len:80 (-) Transcript_65805:31-270(-)